MLRSHRSLAQTGWFPSKTSRQELWNHPACSAFLEFDGLAGTPPNLGGEFQNSCNDDRHVIVLFCAGGKLVGGGDEFRNHFRRRFFLKCPDTRHKTFLAPFFISRIHRLAYAVG